MDRLHFEDSPRQSFQPVSEHYDAFLDDERRDRWNPDDDAEFRYGPRGRRFSRDSQFSERPTSSYQRFERRDRDRYVAQDRFENRPIRYDSRGSFSYTDYDESLDFGPRQRDDFRTPSDREREADRRAQKKEAERESWRRTGQERPGEDFDRFSRQSGYRMQQNDSQRMNRDFNTFPGISSSSSGEQRMNRDAAMPTSKAGRAPKGYKRSDERLQEEVNDLLTDHPGIDASEIEVKVSQGEVTLSGTVESRQEKHLVEDLAAAVVGVGEVVNNLRVARNRDQKS